MKMSKVSCKYGAPMGRCPSLPKEPEQPRKLRMSRMHLDSGGYDNGGAYWGLPSDIYRAWDDSSDDCEVFIRARSRTEAKASVRAVIPGATFYN